MAEEKSEDDHMGSEDSPRNPKDLMPSSECMIVCPTCNKRALKPGEKICAECSGSIISDDNVVEISQREPPYQETSSGDSDVNQNLEGRLFDKTFNPENVNESAVMKNIPCHDIELEKLQSTKETALDEQADRCDKRSDDGGNTTSIVSKKSDPIDLSSNLSDITSDSTNEMSKENNQQKIHLGNSSGSIDNSSEKGASEIMNLASKGESGTFESYYAEYPLPHLVPMLSSHHCLNRGPIKRPSSSDLNRIASPAKRSTPNEALNTVTTKNTVMTKDTVTVQGENDHADEEKSKKRRRDSHDDGDDNTEAKQLRTRSRYGHEIPGLTPNLKESMAVEFHIVVHRQHWNYDSSYHNVKLVFGDSKLGNWNECIGDFHTTRATEEGMLVMSCTLNLKVEVVKKPLAYKYVVIIKNELFHENLDSSLDNHKGFINRCLIIAQESLHPGGTYHQYDGMILPPQQSDSWFQSFKKLFGRGSNKIDLPPHSSNQKQCLDIFLEKYKEVLCSAKLMDSSFQRIVCEILHIYKQLQIQKLCRDETHLNKDTRQVEKFKSVFLKKMENISMSLLDIKESSDFAVGRKMCSVLVIITIIGKVTKDKKRKYYVPDEVVELIIMLFSMLQMVPMEDNGHDKISNEIVMILQFLKQDDCQVVSEILVSYASSICQRYGLRSPEWLYVIPLLNAITNTTSTSAKNLNYRWNNIYFNLPSFNTLKDAGIQDISIFEKILMPMALADSKLLPQWIFICPREKLHFFWSRVSVAMSSSFICQVLLDPPRLKVKENMAFLSPHLPCWLKTLMQELQKSSSSLSMMEKRTVWNNANEIYRKIIFFPYDVDLQIELLSSSVMFLLHSLLLCSDNGSTDICRTRLLLSTTLKNKFKNQVQWKTPIIIDVATKEIEVIDYLAQIECPECHKEMWLNVLKDILNFKIDIIKLSGERLKLLSILESLENPSVIVTDVIADSIISVFDQISYNELMPQFKKYPNQVVVGKIADRIMGKHIPTGSDNVTMTLLLEWNHWPLFLTLFRSEVQSSAHNLSDHVNTMCSMAYTKLEYFFRGCLTGEITLHEINEVATNKSILNLKKIIKVIMLNATKQEEDIFQYQHIDHCIAKVAAFKTHKTLLLFFCDYLKGENKDVQGLDQLIEEVRENHEQLKVSDMKFSDDTQFVSTYFQIGLPIQPILIQFNVIFNEYQNQFSNHFFKVALKTLTSLRLVSFVTDIWEPVYTKCLSFVKSVRLKTIKLSEVHDIYEYVEDREEVKTHLHLLQSALEKCQNRIPVSVPPKWMQDCIEHMSFYLSLCDESHAANLILKLKTKLSLGGNFEMVENVAKQMVLPTQDDVLLSIDKNIVATAVKFFAELTSNKDRYLSIKKFAECSDIVQWIQKETKEVNDLHKFVSVALHTSAGEDDYSHDRLSQLKIVASGYGPLIYHLNKNSGFDHFQRYCKEVWVSLDQTPQLPKLLEACNIELEWFKSVKETQGSVEVTSIGQMKNILKNGCYFIGSSRPDIRQKSNEVVRLKLTEKDRESRIVKKKYNLEELHDLESKLVLITGSKAEYRKEVELFLDILHRVCHIADVLLSLQQVGNVKYIGWSFQIPCSTEPFQIVNSLQYQIVQMEDELVLWNCKIQDMRNDFYELNYYTTSQLLMLRQALVKLKHDEGVILDSDILALLHSIHPKIESKNVKNAIKMAAVNEVTSVVMQPEVFMETSKNSELKDVLEMMNQESEHPKAENGRQVMTEEELSVSQKEIMSFIINQIGCTKKLVLWIFQENFSEEKNKYDYLNLCTRYQNESDYDFSEDESEASSEDSLSIDSEDDAESTEINQEAGPIVHTERPGHDLASIKTIHASIVQPVNENHEFVQELVRNCSYSLDLSIRAVEATRGRSLAAALDYLQSGTEFEDISNQLFEHQFFRLHSDDFEDIEIDESTALELVIRLDEEVEKKYFTVAELGCILKHLRDLIIDEIEDVRFFPSNALKEGFPNLLVIKPDEVYITILHLYMRNTEMPLPSQEEVFICKADTTAEEVELFWRRAIYDPQYKRLFCLVNAEELSSIVCDSALHSLFELSQAQQGYRLVILYCPKGEMESQLVTKLKNYRRPFFAERNINVYKEYLSHKFKKSESPSCAASVDYENSCVRIITSQRCAMGKSLYVRRLAESLEQKGIGSAICNLVTIPLHGPYVDENVVMKLLESHVNKSKSCIYHIDIAPSVISQVSTIIFNLLVLGGIRNSQGKVWRCHPDQLYVVEVSLPNLNNENFNNSDSEYLTTSLLSLFPTISCLTPRKSLHNLKTSQICHSELCMDKHIFKSDSYQRAFQYLNYQGADLDHFKSKGVVGSPEECLETLLRSCGVKDPSWAEICYFATFLNLQLQSCENSDFTNYELVGDIFEGFKSFVVKFMMKMSRDFSTSSLKGEVAIENSEETTYSDTLINYQIDDRKKWEQSPHPYIFFNKDGNTITFVGFMIRIEHHWGDLINPYDGQVLEKSIITEKLHKSLVNNKVNFEDNSQKWTKKDMITKLCTVMGTERYDQRGHLDIQDPDKSYVLTVDNVIKILAIQMRFRCGIPVVVMGETGCGKTRLIRYMCDLARQDRSVTNMVIMKVHGGKTEKDIKNFIDVAMVKAAENAEEGLDTVVFFDEANTTDALDLIKEILCDHRLKGVPINSNLKFIAACNPYRKHKDEMIERLQNAGLGFFVKDSETQQKLGKIPLRQLVYRVLDLPPSMRPLVYDFGRLNLDTEMDYIDQIVQNHLKKQSSLKSCLGYVKPIALVLKTAQEYMRRKDDECSFVSLRDVDRAMIVFEYFFAKMKLFGPRMEKWARDHPLSGVNSTILSNNEHSHCIIRSLILSISMCYRARLQKRDEFDEEISSCFCGTLNLDNGSTQFRSEIRWCQEVLLDSMSLGENIARNAALRENVFMMAISIELKIPLFLVGKPGSSKSLAKAIINDSMRGKDSKNELLKNFNEVLILSYQCSQLSTSSSIIKLFHDAKRYQDSEKQNKKSFVAVVVLDEVGLAEDSPNLPLKSLHPLLEDGTEGSNSEGGFSDEIIDRSDRVAFIGISNWALDPAKMNRGIMVTRNDPTEKELVFSARGICSNKMNDPVKLKLEQYFNPLAKAYLTVCKRQKREFFGLRDFYSLIKMLYNMCKKSERHPTWNQLEHAIKRNFGGFDSQELNPFEIFEECLIQKYLKLPSESFSSKFDPVLYPDCSRLGLIRTSLSNSEKTWHGENRYALFLTENYAALDILKNPNYLEVDITTSQTKCKVDQPFILFGSSFPKDKEYTQVCRNINQIKICMETGRTVILLNLENLYESLYDVLNQYYIHHAGSRYVDLGLQTHRVRCRVADEFRLILIAERKTVYQKFPTPLINRMEKHFVLISSVLEKWQEELLEEFETWISKYSSPRNHNFKKSDAFIGFQTDTPASVLYYATNQLRLALASKNIHQITKLQDMLGNYFSDSITSFEIDDLNSEKGKKLVLHFSKFLILQTASPDSIFRLKDTTMDQEEVNRISDIYFNQQHHGCLKDFLQDCFLGNEMEKRFMQITTHSHRLPSADVGAVLSELGITAYTYSLLGFDTELDFSNKIGPLFKKTDHEMQDSIVIIQCNSGHLYGDLIACARYRVYDLMSKGDQEKITHVLFIIHLPRQISCSLVGFQGDPWISSHIDDLIPTEADNAIELDQVLGEVFISDVFMGNLPFKDQKKYSDLSSLLQRNSDQNIDTDRTMLDISSMEDGELGQSYHKDGGVAMSEINLDFETTEETMENIGEKLMNETNILSPPISPKPSICPSRNPFYRNLYKCIQPAASKLKDITMKRSTERVNILVRLIPKNIDQLDSSQFHGILIKYIYTLLQEKEQLFESKRNWILEESLNTKSLLLGGTLCNVLSRKVYEAIVQVFAEIIFNIDRNCNLNLVNPNYVDDYVLQLWLSIFKNSQIMQFKYTNFVRKEDFLPGIGARKSGPDFEGEFPFSWLVYQLFAGLLSKVACDKGVHGAKIQDQLTALVKSTFLGEVLSQFNKYNEELLKKYLSDFVQIVYVISNNNYKIQKKFYSLLSQSLETLIDNHAYCTNSDAVSLIGRISALHVVYQLNRSQVMWFGQLVRYNPSAIVNLTIDEVKDPTEMILPLCAANKALDSLSLELDKHASEINLFLWLQDIRNSQNVVSSILYISSRSALQSKASKKWQLLRALQLFVEHILIQHSSMPLHFLRRLYILLKEDTDFLTAKCLIVIQKNLNATVKDAKKKDSSRNPKRYIEEKETPTFERNCRNYFMEVISSLCFGQYAVPEQDLIKMLMQIIFVDKKTRDLTYHKEGKKDKKATIRSALLQLLLEYRSTDAKIYLNEYFSNSYQALSADFDLHLFLMSLQCFEDALHKENGNKISDQLRTVVEKLENSFYIICKCKPYNTTIEYLEAIASIRFYFHEVTNTFYLISEENRPVLKDTEHELIDKVRMLCTNQTINNSIVGPGIYLIRLFVRKYGFSSLMKLTKIFKWIIPDELLSDDQQQVLDPFVLYNSHGYNKIRGDIHDAKVVRQLQSLQESIEDMNLVESTIFVLAFFKVITMSNATATPSIDAEMGEKFDDCLRNIKLFTPEMLRISRCFLANEQGGSLFQMKIRPGLSQSCQASTLIVAHTVSVLVSRKKYSIFHPFVNMMSNAAALHGAYLPTMFDDPFDEVRKAGGNFYACPNGHRYFIGECGRPWVEGTCDVCSARIGGARHNLRSDNSVASSNDTTQRGHILGYANTRANIGAPERNLPAAAVSIIRAIMHSCLIWFSCHHSDCIGQLVQIVKCSVLPHNLPEFFWMHLQKDIKNLSSSIGRSIDESAVLIHLVLKRMLFENPPKDTAADNCSRLDTKIARKSWEEAYCTHYVRPVLQDLNNLLSESMKEIVNDTSLEQDQLLNAVYETETVPSDDIELHLWTYRQRVSLEHLRLTMLTSKENFPLLYEFLHMEPRLRATQYLPHIVKLQQTLYDTYNFRLDRTVAVTCTIDKFIEEIQNENSKNEYSQWITSLQKAWDLVSMELITHGRMPVPENILPQSISGSTSLEYLIPTTSGTGVCTTSLVDFLVLTHNDFIEMCHKAMCKKEEDRSQMQWLKNEVPITQIHSCHLLDYEDQIISVVLSHCHYSLRAGEGHTVTYDYQSLQKHILDKFVYGKPIILSDIPKVVYRKDIHTTDTFEAVRNKVKPQEQIDPETRKEIITELHTPALLRTNLDIIDTVLGFLSSGGGKPNMSLGKYIDKVLKMRKERFSRKAQEYCKLVHIVSLWKILSVELAKVTWLHKQEPFDALSDLLLVPLSEEDKVALDRCLRAFDLNKLLGSLFEFLETSAGYFDENGLSWPLTMVVVEDKYENLQLPDHFKDEFPDTITVAQTAAAWKHIVDYQKENKLTNI